MTGRLFRPLCLWHLLGFLLLGASPAAAKLNERQCALAREAIVKERAAVQAVFDSRMANIDSLPANMRQQALANLSTWYVRRTAELDRQAAEVEEDCRLGQIRQDDPGTQGKISEPQTQPPQRQVPQQQTPQQQIPQQQQPPRQVVPPVQPPPRRPVFQPQQPYPQQGYPQPGYPQVYPQPGYPPQGYPPPGYPQPGFPQPGVPQPGYSDPGLPQTGIPQVQPVIPVRRPFQQLPVNRGNLPDAFAVPGTVEPQTVDPFAPPQN